jgi:hypothetical protein
MRLKELLEMITINTNGHDVPWWALIKLLIAWIMIDSFLVVAYWVLNF